MQSQDYLKYWRVVRYFIKRKYNLTTSDLEMLLFLKSEGRFSKENFQEFNELLSWDKSRFERLRQQGWIEVFRKRVGKHRAKYQLSFKSKRVLSSVYKKLNGEVIPTTPFSDKVYTDKLYRNFIKQLLHPSPE